MSNMWQELRSRIELNRRASYGDPPIFNLITEIMDDIEKKYWHDATNEFILKHRYMIEKQISGDEGSIEWAVREAMKQNVVYNTNDGLHRVLAETIYSGLLCIREGINLTLIPKSGWYAEKKPLKSISELW